ncbi:MAG TPA: ROK family protein [Candidatus Limnocylindrales bacterium]|nr:ROK family protein [Candidatus Limnocylindrales bacterium]
MSRPPVLALDLGGTRIRAAVVQSDGTRSARVDTETPVEDGPAAIVRACREAVAQARSKAPAEVAEAVVGIGISSPGPVDPERGIVVEPPNLGPSFRNVLLAQDVSRSQGLPAFLERDTNVAALAEHAFGAARGVDDFLYITVSTGVGGAIVSGGRILHGPDGLAGELGHVPVAMSGPRCGCGGIGHVEAFASGTALARDARALVASDGSTFLVERARRIGGPNELSAKDVAEGALAGDRACVELMERARRALAVACVGYVNAFNPHRIVIGGSIAEAEGDRLLGPIRDAIAREAFEVIARHVRVVPAALGADVSLAGAFPLVMSRLDEPGPTAIPARPAKPAVATARR